MVAVTREVGLDLTHRAQPPELFGRAVAQLCVNRAYRCDRWARGQQTAVGPTCHAGVGREAVPLPSYHGRDLTNGEDRRARVCALSVVSEIAAARVAGGRCRERGRNDWQEQLLEQKKQE